MDWQRRFAKTRATIEDAIALIGPGHDIFISSGAAEPIALVRELVKQAERFTQSVVVHLLTLGPAPYVEPAYADNFRHKAFFIGPNVRSAVHEGRADYTPVFLSQIPTLIRTRRMPVDVALIQCSPPDRNGFVNLGVSVDIVLSAVESAQLVIAQVNPQMPVVFGAGYIPMDRIDAWFVEPMALPELPPEPLDEVALEIGRNVAELVDDGSTLQLGIGQIPDAVLRALDQRQNLGVWTEMFSDGVIDLIENGNINGRFCTTHPERVSSSFTFGSERLYRFIDRNPLFVFEPSDRINDPMAIARQHKMVAINSALQLDLTGQVCADSIGGKFYSGIGGQVDFIRGASMCSEGKPIIALRSTAKSDTISRIVPVLDPGAGVVTSRGDVHYIVTEYGVADLKGRSVRARALALASIAHPSFRGELLSAAKQRRYVPPSTSALTVEPEPGHLERQVEGPEGAKVLLRPARPSDHAELQAYIEELEHTDDYKRWASAAAESAPERRMIYHTGDPRKALTLLALRAHRGNDQIVGLAHFRRDKATDFAEIVVHVAPRQRARTIGTELLRLLTAAALERGLAGFAGYIDARDVRMMHLLHELGFEVQSVLEGQCYRFKIPLRKRDRRASDR